MCLMRSNKPSSNTTAANKSGRWFAHAARTRAPTDPPNRPRVEGEVRRFAMSHSAAAKVSSTAVCLRTPLPESCQRVPYSPPPLALTAQTMTPKHFANTSRGSEKAGMTLTPKAPNAVKMHGRDSAAKLSLDPKSNSGTCCPSLDVTSSCRVSMRYKGSIPGTLALYNGSKAISIEPLNTSLFIIAR